MKAMKTRPYRPVLACCVVLCLPLTGSCRSGRTGPKTPPAGKTVLIEGIPHVRQKPDFCGEACAEMVLRKLGSKIDQDAVFDQSGVDPHLGRGCHTAELAGALKKIGFDVGSVWHKIGAAKPDKDLSRLWGEVLADLKRGVPSIVCTHYDAGAKSTEHFRLVVGHDPAKDEVIYHEPAKAKGAHLRMPRSRFLKLWPLKYDKKRWTVIRLALKAGKIVKPKTPATKTFTNADYAQHVMKLKKKIPAEGFSFLIERPFVVVGDESPSRLRQRAKHTVGWAVRLLKKDYFPKDPGEILDIWLFKDRASYLKHNRTIFHHKPTTPYGYFSHANRALVMNIATGGGTLVHEIVHPFVRANFPKCPSWFDEGLASLYEQCAEVGGHIHGRTNWRLAGLQKAIRANGVPSFKQLCSTTTHQFYNEDPGTNYAQARYLCYYLQQRGLLVKFYRAFHAAQKEDPTGYETLKKTLRLKEADVPAFKKTWQAWVLKLRFP